MSQISCSTRDALVDIEICYKEGITMYTIHISKNRNPDKFECRYSKYGLFKLEIIPESGNILPESFYVNGVVYTDNIDTVNRRKIYVNDTYQICRDYITISPDIDVDGYIDIDNRFYLSSSERVKMKYKKREEL